MALPTFTAGTNASAADMTAIVNHLQGASGSTDAWHFRMSAANDLLITLSDAAGARKVSIRDSALVEVFSLDSDGNLTIAGTFTQSVLQLPTSSAPTQTGDGRVVWDSDDDRLTVGTGAATKVIGLSRGAGSNASATQELVYDTTAATLKVWDGSASMSVGSLPGLLTDILNQKALLAFLDVPFISAPASGAAIGLGLIVSKDGSGTTAAADGRGGVLSIAAGTTGDSQCVLDQPAKTAFPDRNPYFACRLTSQAANAALKVQGWGFRESEAASSWTTTADDAAMFRSVTTGALFAVTANSGATETTTSLSASHTLGNAGVFEVYTTDDGVTWIFKIAGVTVATHTTNVPVVTNGLKVVVGIENNTTTDMVITAVDLILAYQDRT